MAKCKGQQDDPFLVQQLVALRKKNREAFLFSGIGYKWIDSTSKNLTREKIEVKDVVYTRHRNHPEWLTIEEARAKVPDTLRELLAKARRLFVLTPTELANLDDIPNNLSKKKRAMLNEFLGLFPRYPILAGSIFDEENKQYVVPEVLASFQKYVDLREELLKDHQGYLIGALYKSFAAKGLFFDDEVKNDAYNAVRDAIDLFNPVRSLFSTFITNAVMNFCKGYFTELTQKNAREKQIVSKDDEDDEPQSITLQTPDTKMKRPDEIASDMEVEKGVNLRLKNPKIDLNDPNNRLLFGYLGIEYVNGKLEYSEEGGKTLAELGQTYGITPQAAQGRIQRAKQRLAPLLKNLL